MKWSPGAEKELELFLEGYQRQFASDDVDLEDLREDVRLHILEEVSSLGVEVVTREHLVRLIKKSDFDIAPENEAQSQASKGRQVCAPNKFKPSDLIFYILFSILLPLGAILVELIEHPFAEMFFDPLPDLLHVFLCSAAPLSNIFMLRKIIRNQPVSKSLLMFNSFGIVCGIYYAIYFLPMVPLSVMAILLMGMGFLSLSPLLALFGAFLLRRRYKAIYTQKPVGRSRLFYSFLTLFVVLVCSKIPVVVTEYGLYQLSESANSQEKKEALEFLRRWGSSSYISRKNNNGFDRGEAAVGDIPSFYDYDSMNLAEVYYRLYGEGISPVENHFRGDFLGSNQRRRRTWDSNVGEQVVGEIRKNLTLASSRFDTSIDAGAAIAYSEWILEFEHKGDFQNEEARMELLLPNGALISRLTLWVDGEEREAAFAKNSQVKTAYKNVVRSQRDPVLVTWSGRNRVFVQCFPVLPGKKMKIRLGVTSKLSIDEDLTTARFFYPGIFAKNFIIPHDIKHHLWLESQNRISAPADLKLKEENLQESLYTIRGQLNHHLLNKNFHLVLQRGSQNTYWAVDKNEPKSAVLAVLKKIKPHNYKRISILIDGSKNMKKHVQKIASSL